MSDPSIDPTADTSASFTSHGHPEIIVHLRKGREKAIRQHHPWLFSGAVHREEGDPAAAVARVVSPQGEALGTGFFSPGGRVRVRMAGGPEEALDAAFFHRRVSEALALRRDLLPTDTTGYRLLNAEGDGLPGWTVDRFGDVLVSQITSAGLEALRGVAYGALRDVLANEGEEPSALVQRNDLSARRHERLSQDDEVILGEVPRRVPFQESGLTFYADLEGGQKTGFYCDQRSSRRLVESLASGPRGGRRVLDLFAHTGAFSLYALRGGARAVTAVESAPRPLEHAAEHLQANAEQLGDPLDRSQFQQADVFEYLRQIPSDLQGADRPDLIVCDPPPLAVRRSARDAGARAYKDLNRLAMACLAPGGLLLTFTCSSAIDPRLFRQILFASAREAGTRVQMLRPLAAGPDHPVSIYHPEGEYLKGWLLRRVE